MELIGFIFLILSLAAPVLFEGLICISVYGVVAMPIFGFCQIIEFFTGISFGEVGPLVVSGVLSIIPIFILSKMFWEMWIEEYF